MHEIICPHCAKAFKIDEAGYADILKQVRDTEFEQQLNARLELAAQERQRHVVARSLLQAFQSGFCVPRKGGIRGALCKSFEHAACLFVADLVQHFAGPHQPQALAKFHGVLQLLQESLHTPADLRSRLPLQCRTQLRFDEVA